ncbi:MAG: hypothetical protein AAF702_42180 [Chloroflexota bacterium]
MNSDMNLDNDDIPVGKILSRREMIRLLGASSLSSLIVACAPISPTDGTTSVTTTEPMPAPTEASVAADAAENLAPINCVAQPELTEGPYFVDVNMDRFDLRMTNDNVVKAGFPMLFTVQISDVTDGTCKPLPGAIFDLWNCDAIGEYSAVLDENGNFDTRDESWLRGTRVSDENGNLQMLTIIPSWYSTRAIHSHFKIRTQGTDGNAYEFTSQLFFKADQMEPILATQAYIPNGMPPTSNEIDDFYLSLPEPEQLTLDLAEMSGDELAQLKTLAVDTAFDQAVKATFSIGLDLSNVDVGASDAWDLRGGGDGRRRP